VARDVYSPAGPSRLGVPTIKGIPGAYRFYFFSFDCTEPMHVHVQRENRLCKFWLAPLALARNHGFSPAELNRIRRTIGSHLPRIMEAWHEHCG
jgi:hypothetical protein